MKPPKDETFYNQGRYGLAPFSPQAGDGHARLSVSKPVPIGGMRGWEESGTTGRAVGPLVSPGERFATATDVTKSSRQTETQGAVPCVLKTLENSGLR